MCVLTHYHQKMSSSVFKDSDDFILKRKRQIDTLKIFNDNVQEVEPGAEYRVEFWVDARRMAIVVQLGPDFPLKKPTLIISPVVKHPWVDPVGHIRGAPGLITFTVNSDLGRVVHAIVREFEVQKLAPIPNESTSGAECFPPSAPPFEAVNPESPPKKETSLFPELADLPTSELEKLHSSDDYKLEFLLEHSPLKQQTSTLNELMAATEELAKENLRREAVLQKARKECELRKQLLAAQRDSFQTLCARYQALADRRSPASIRESLRAATTKADEQSEEIAQEFLSGAMTVDKFLVAYGSTRVKSHERRVKEEKLSQQLRDLLRAGY